MTVPNAGASAYTLKQSDGPRLLIRRAGADDDAPLIVNNGTVRLYVAGDSMLTPSTGIPVEAGTALPWTAGGEVYGLADPAAAPASATCFVTAAIESWSPSPAALAAQVALQLVASSLARDTASAIGATGVPVTNPTAIGTAVGAAVPVPPSASSIGSQTATQLNGLGVPIVQQSALVFAQNVVTVGTLATANFDVSAYQTLSFYIRPRSGADADLSFFHVQWFDDAGNFLDEDFFGSWAGAVSTLGYYARLPVKGHFVAIQNITSTNAVATFDIRVTGHTVSTAARTIKARGLLFYNRATGPYRQFAPMILDARASMAANGGSFTYYLPPVAARVRVAMTALSASAPAGAVALQIFTVTENENNQAYTSGASILSDLKSTDTVDVSAEFAAPFGLPMKVVVTNTDTTSSRAPNVQVWDVS